MNQESFSKTTLQLLTVTGFFKINLNLPMFVCLVFVAAVATVTVIDFIVSVIKQELLRRNIDVQIGD